MVIISKTVNFQLWGTSSFDSSVKNTSEMILSKECPKIIYISHRTVQWLMSKNMLKSPILGHSVEGIISCVVFSEESNELVPQSQKCDLQGEIDHFIKLPIILFDRILHVPYVVETILNYVSRLNIIEISINRMD